MLLCGCRSGEPLTTSLNIAQAGGHSVCKQHAARLWLTRPRGVTDTLLDMLSRVSQLHAVCGDVKQFWLWRAVNEWHIALLHAFYADEASDNSTYDLESKWNMLEALAHPKLTWSCCFRRLRPA